MTAEQQRMPVATEATAAATQREHNPQHRKHTPADIGHSSLEGFTIIESTTSAWDDVREGLEGRIIGQPAAIDAVIESLEGSAVRTPSDTRPVATLAFLGPTGVGKSETAKTLSELIDGTQKLVKIDCSNYSHGHEVADLIGAPVGYVGYGQEPILSPDSIHGYGTVVLFDEIEKGSEELFNIMLQIMEDGEVQLKNDDVTSFREAIIIMTSNLGAKEMASQLSSTSLGFGRGDKHKHVTSGQLEDVATKSFREYFRPEFINRLSKMIVFHPLDQDALGQVLDSKLARTNHEFESEMGARLSISDTVRDYLIDIASKELHMGARPLVRALDDNIYTAFGRIWGSGAIQESTHVKVFHRSEVERKTTDEESALVFAAKQDASIRKKPQPAKVSALPFVGEEIIFDQQDTDPDEPAEVEPEGETE